MGESRCIPKDVRGCHQHFCRPHGTHGSHGLRQSLLRTVGKVATMKSASVHLSRGPILKPSEVTTPSLSMSCRMKFARRAGTSLRAMMGMLPMVAMVVGSKSVLVGFVYPHVQQRDHRRPLQPDLRDP